jgi:hypothetical protein
MKMDLIRIVATPPPLSSAYPQEILLCSPLRSGFNSYDQHVVAVSSQLHVIVQVQDCLRVRFQSMLFMF